MWPLLSSPSQQKAPAGIEDNPFLLHPFLSFQLAVLRLGVISHLDLWDLVKGWNVCVPPPHIYILKPQPPVWCLWEVLGLDAPESGAPMMGVALVRTGRGTRAYFLFFWEMRTQQDGHCFKPGRSPSSWNGTRLESNPWTFSASRIMRNKIDVVSVTQSILFWHLS